MELTARPLPGPDRRARERTPTGPLPALIRAEAARETVPSDIRNWAAPLRSHREQAGDGLDEPPGDPPACGGGDMIEAILPGCVVAADLFHDPPDATLFPEEEKVIEQSVEKRR